MELVSGRGVMCCIFVVRFGLPQRRLVVAPLEELPGLVAEAVLGDLDTRQCGGLGDDLRGRGS